jgi:hypothetical protein
MPANPAKWRSTAFAPAAVLEPISRHPRTVSWLTQSLERIAQGWPISNIDQLMPWNFKA